MESLEASSYLAEMFDRPRVAFLYASPNPPDFSIYAPCQIVLAAGPHHIRIDLNRDNASTVAGLLTTSVFDPSCSSSLLTWDIKSLLSYFQACLGKVPEITAPLLDIHIIESFLGVKKSPPETLSEAVVRVKESGVHKNWKSLYSALYLPLVKEVMPSLESVGILDESTKTARFAHYEIEGQRNGRLLCSNKFEKGYLPHTLGPEQKSAMKPRGYNQEFILADMRHCEVNVLQWLSNDRKLGEIIESGKDLYREIYRILTEDACDTDKKREIAKSIFLPVLYGCGASKLSENTQLPEAVAKKLIQRIRIHFPSCCEWLDQIQKQAIDTGIVVDYFGRPREFKDRQHAARNFVVQSVAATACLEKLLTLHRQLSKTPAKLCFSVHDGYGIVAPIDRRSEIASLTRNALETVSTLCPGLSLKVEIKAGKRLDGLVTIN